MIVQDNQSVLDLALMAGGTIECMFELAEENNLSVSQKVVPGREITSEAVVTKEQDILDYYTNNNIAPATVKATELYKGIGNMIIGKDFIVG